MNQVERVGLVGLVLVLGLMSVIGHSWIACTKYTGDIFTDRGFDATKCAGYPRNWAQNGGRSAFGVTLVVQWGENDFRNGQAPNAPVCFGRPGASYPSNFPAATYTVGERVKLVWPAKNHGGPRGSAVCNDQHRDGFDYVFAFCGPRTADPSIMELVNNPDANPNLIADLKKTDKGFHNCFNFCADTDKAACQGSFTIPSTLSGTCTFIWLWELNRLEYYTSCWEANVINTGGVTTVAPVTTTSAPATTTRAPVTTSAPATTTRAPVTTSAPATTTRAPVTTSAPATTTRAPVTTSAPATTTRAPITTAAPATTTRAPVTTQSPPVTTTSAPVTTRSGAFVRINRLNRPIPITGNFQVELTWHLGASAQFAKTVVFDVLSTDYSIFYGRGFQNVDATTTNGLTLINVALSRRIPNNREVIVTFYIVKRQLWEADVNSAWQFPEAAGDDVRLIASSSASRNLAASEEANSHSKLAVTLIGSAIASTAFIALGLILFLKRRGLPKETQVQMVSEKQEDLSASQI